MKTNALRGIFLIACVLTASCHLWAMPQKYITYEQFGAKGDGVHDDLEAIAAAHRAANEQHLPVRAADDKTYLIGKGATTVVIKTDVDFGKAKFIINDVETDNYKSWVFRVESYLKPYDVEGVTSLKRGQQNIGVKFPQNSLIEVINDRKKVYIRYGLNQNSGTPAREVFVVDKKGNVRDKSQIVWDYDHISQIKAYPMDKETLTIKGGIFTTVANQAPSTYAYRSRGFIINRSNVRVEGVTHYVTGELDHGAPYRGFLYVDHCVDVVLSNCLFTAHKTYVTIGSAKKPVSMGSYDTGAMSAVNVLFEHCRQTTDIDDNKYWGLYASNFCKDLRMDDCHFSRFDAHMGVANVTLTNCKFGYMGVRMVGFGTIRMENCEVRYNTLIALRDDYGSSWDGDIIIKNCTLRPVNPNYRSLTILSGTNTGKHDFGYLCRLPYKMVIDGLTVDDSALNPDKYEHLAIFATFNRDAHDTGLLPFPIEGQVILKNVKVQSGRECIVSANPDLYRNVEVIR